MHDDDNSRRTPAPHEEDERDQEGIMGLALAEHPIQLTVSEVIREMAPADAAFGDADRIERGIRDLVGIGLLHRNGDTIRPTRAALRLNHLFFDRDSAKS
ncbi:MAG TPA: hypothetical protein VMS60_11275 [Solirubrobacterales bacterium]|nr:hypothetical protein [Solirubrobacterales bacterium]